MHVSCCREGRQKFDHTRRSGPFDSIHFRPCSRASDRMFLRPANAFDRWRQRCSRFAMLHTSVGRMRALDRQQRVRQAPICTEHSAAAATPPSVQVPSSRASSIARRIQRSVVFITSITSRRRSRGRSCRLRITSRTLGRTDGRTHTYADA
jgi:hypothetical protein